MSRPSATLALASTILAATTHGCLTHTQLSLSITTDVPCSELTDVTISVGPSSQIETMNPSTSTTTCTDNGSIGTITVIPSGSDSSSVAIKVVGGVGRQAESCTAPSYGAGCIVARRELAFVPHTSLTLPILLSQSCDGVACAPDETCVEATCQSSVISNPSACEGTGCGESTLSAPDGATSCPHGRGPSMVRVGAGSGGYCIDSTHVTRFSYAQFLAANVPLSSQPTECSFVTDFTPAANWPPSPTTENLPVVNVNWCDAHAFCAWAGKRLCGAIGGGASSQANANSATVDQWYSACSAGGKLTYPYGNTYEAKTCNDPNLGVDAPTPVASLVGCVGGYPGLFDMSGNVLSWEDACDTSGGGNSANDVCLKRGGYFDTSSDACASLDSANRGANYDFAGFRCCSP